MATDSKIPRFEILSLNLSDIKRSQKPSAQRTKLILSEDHKDSKPLPQYVVKPWTLTLSNKVLVSRNKVGARLLQHCRNGFLLDDPFIQRSRFFVDYHRLHDPGLKRYYNSIPVRNRLRKLRSVTSQNDALCTPQQFVEYLRYLDNNIAIREFELEKARVKSSHTKF